MIRGGALGTPSPSSAFQRLDARGDRAVGRLSERGPNLINQPGQLSGVHLMWPAKRRS